ncbi:hypothetical protein GBAR_LOCUS5580 [Geodia barretti]|uniref:Uncharacterized protein n=1 Tax=Geodia barretti TaxID=519541 RepID=A0AA35W5E0_GEOBA|nr:hypothetical protein GBAR_LOCUS5580 [Geodia barretti]
MRSRHTRDGECADRQAAEDRPAGYDGRGGCCYDGRWMTMNHEERLAVTESRRRVIIDAVKGIEGVSAVMLDNIIGASAVRVGFAGGCVCDRDDGCGCCGEAEGGGSADMDAGAGLGGLHHDPYVWAERGRGVLVG